MKMRLAVHVMVVLSLMVAACGDGVEPPTSTGPAGTTATTIPTATTSTTSPTTLPPATTTTEPVATDTVTVFFSFGDATDCSEVKGYERTHEVGLDPILFAFDELVAGPATEEIADGAGSFFSADTAGIVRSVQRHDDGVLSIDFEDVRLLLNNASTSCGSEALLSQIEETAFQFDEVERLRLAINGNCSVFFNWLQRECMELTRDGSTTAGSIEDFASRSGCTPGTDELPDGEWFGYVDDASAGAVTFDLACWFSGTAAAQAAAEDGEETPPPNDYYIRNSNTTLRTVPVASGAEANWMPSPGDPNTATTVVYAAWLDGRATRDFQPGVWLHVTDGAIVLVEEQYQP